MTTTLGTEATPDPAGVCGQACPALPRPPGELPVLAALLAGTGVLYLWNLSASGYANSFYAAAVQAGTQSWKALLFGSLDSANAITVDKPPASLWVMALSGRLFGFSSWSMLAPQALMGVGAVALLWATVRRVAGPVAGLLAGAVLALTPAAVLMFRFNNPDALLVLLMVGAAWATTRAIERARTGWLLLAGSLIGLAFLTKMLQGFLVLPGLVLAYLWAAPTSLGRRIGQLLAAGVAIVVSAGWWLLVVALWPAAARPYIGGSTDNTVLELALGYNGLGRLLGGERGGPGRVAERAAGAFPGGPDAAFGPPGAAPGGAMGGFGGQAGLTRLFNTEIGGQISWLLPAALLLLGAGLWFTRRAPRTDRTRAGLLLWGGWTVVTALVFALMQGTFHAYYTIALAPGIAALVAIGSHQAWRARTSWTGRLVLAVAGAVTVTWGWALLGRSATFLPWLRWTVLVLGVLAAAAFLLPVGRRRWIAVVATAAVLAGFAGPTAYAVQTALTPHRGSIPTAGPAVAGERFPGDGSAGPGQDGRADGTDGAGRPGRADSAPEGIDTDAAGGFGGPGTGTVDAELTALLTTAGTRWAAATSGAQGAASLELSTGAAVLAIGGFTGSDPYPTLEQFQAFVANGEIHYFIPGNRGGAPGGERGTGSAITAWVQQHHAVTTVGGRTVYDLTRPLK